MEKLNKNLGNRIKTLRKMKGWTQENLAEQAKVSIQHVGEIERGDGNPTLQSLERLSLGLGVTAAQLLEVEPRDQAVEMQRGQIIDVVKTMSETELRLLMRIIELTRELSMQRG